MEVIKRNGKKEEFKFDKIKKRILAKADGLSVDVDTIAQKVISGMYDGVKTTELDELIAETSAVKAVDHPDYTTLASRIAVSALHKETSTFKNTVLKLYNNKDPKTGEKAPLVSEELYYIVMSNSHFFENIINKELDYSYDYFGFKTLCRSYLLRSEGKIIETPQYMLMRVSIGIHGADYKNIEKTYNLLSGGYFTHATPTLFNAGTPRPQMSSCFLLDIKEDSIEGIYDTLKSCAKISQYAGGIGLAIHKIRATGSYIKGTSGTSNGIVPMLRVFNDTARYVDQGGGKRKGSFAIYMEPWHADIFDLLDLKKNHGKEEQRARDLFYGLWIPDLFMKRVESSGDWTLMCPNECPGLHEVYGEEFDALYEKYEAEGKGRKTIKAQELWFKILESQIETGTPYMLYKDAANKKSNQKNLGTIKSSNLCVAPETFLLTDKGNVKISELEGQDVTIWNGVEWSKTKVVKTGVNQDLLKVSLSDGKELDCTHYHKWYVQEGYNELSIKEKRTFELEPGDRIVKLSTPLIERSDLEFTDAYTQGFFSGDGCSYKGKNHIDLYGEKILLAPFLKGEFVGSYSEEQDRKRFNVSKTYTKFETPINYNTASRVSWLEGLADADGTVCNNNGSQSVQICSVEFDFLKEIQLMLQELGVQSKVSIANKEGYRSMPDGNGGYKDYLCKTSYRLLIGASGIKTLQSIGFSPKRLRLSSSLPNRNSEHFVKVVSVSDFNRKDDTYCVNEPIRHMAVFNGILTGNCTEIIEYTDPNEIAVCNLASLALPKFVTKDGAFDFDKLYEVTYQATVNLNRVIDRNFYPTPETERSNMRHRPIGLGVQGLADAFILMRYAFDTEHARKLNRDIFETIYYAAMTASHDLAVKYGSYDTFEGSPASKGLLQFDLWGVEPSDRYDWAELKRKIMHYGLRNSLLLAPMPTASTAQILGNNEAFEPYTSNLYTRRVLAGEFIMVNKHLINDLINLGLWNEGMKQKLMVNNGSVINIPEIPTDIKELYRTVWEIPQKAIIDMSADRGAFICQSQSLNIFMENANFGKLTSMHFYGWKKGLKTGMYYLRTKAATDAIKFTVQKAEEQISCSLDNPEGCESCSG